jgi:hypothetical protein
LRTVLIARVKKNKKNCSGFLCWMAVCSPEATDAMSWSRGLDGEFLHTHNLHSIFFISTTSCCMARPQMHAAREELMYPSAMHILYCNTNREHPAHPDVAQKPGPRCEESWMHPPLHSTSTLNSYQLSIDPIISRPTTKMSTATMPVPMPATRPMPLDDELVALTLQLEELGLVSQSAKGKHPVDQPPDFEVAFTSFRADLDEYKTFLEDQKLAQSIGAAVHTDGPLIGAFAAEEAQSLQDRRFVLDLSNNDPETEAPPRSLMLEAPGAIDDWMSTISETIAAQSIVDFSDDETEAGPSTSFVEGQFGTMKAFSTKVQCVACADDFSRAKIVTTGCGHRYCAKCITKLFMRAAKEEQYYPPRCCKQPISLASVSKHMNAVDLETFRLASIQYTTLEKVWCSNRFCRIFIVPSDRNTALQLATCPRCATRTCTMCSNGYHPGTDCPDDPAIRQTRDLAQTLGWQTCRACHRVVDLRSGCNHIT